MFTQTNKNTACVILQDDKIPWVNCYIIFIIFFTASFLSLLSHLYDRHPSTGVSVGKPNILNVLHLNTDTYA